MKMHNRSAAAFGRRAFLAGAGGLAVGLPWLESRAGGEFAPPKRVVFLVTWNGTNPATHWPTGVDRNFQLGPLMPSLEPYRDRMVIMRGVDNQAAMASGTNGHVEAMRCMFTGRTASGTDPLDYTAGGGVSLDQFIANEIGADTMFKSLEFIRGVWAETFPNFTSFYGAGQPAPFESDAIAFWDRVFSSVDPPEGPDPELLKLREDRKSVLDAVAEQFTHARKGVSKADEQRLDAHAEMILDLERRLAATDISNACVLPERPEADSQSDPLNEVGVDLVAYALSCDLTRVATIGFRQNGYGHIGVTGNYHADYLHQVHHDPQAQAVVDQVKTWDIGRVARFLDVLSSIPEGTGTLFDNTLVVWSDEFCHGYAHQHHEIPYALFSGSDDFFEMGRYLQYPMARSNNELWISVARAMGVDGDFGDPQFGSTPLPGL